MSEKRNFTLDKDAQAYVDRMFPCEKPCDSYGVCDNCIDRSLFQAGYNFAMHDFDRVSKELEKANSELVAQANKILDEKTNLTFKLMEETSKAESMQRFHDNLVKQLQRANKAYSDLQDQKLAAQEQEIEKAIELLSACQITGSPKLLNDAIEILEHLTKTEKGE